MDVSGTNIHVKMVKFNYLKLSLCLIKNTKLKLLTMNLINQIVKKYKSYIICAYSNSYFL